MPDINTGKGMEPIIDPNINPFGDPIEEEPYHICEHCGERWFKESVIGGEETWFESDHHCTSYEDDLNIPYNGKFYCRECILGNITPKDIDAWMRDGAGSKKRITQFCLWMFDIDSNQEEIPLLVDYYLYELPAEKRDALLKEYIQSGDDYDSIVDYVRGIF